MNNWNDKYSKLSIQDECQVLIKFMHGLTIIGRDCQHDLPAYKHFNEIFHRVLNRYKDLSTPGGPQWSDKDYLKFHIEMHANDAPNFTTSIHNCMLESLNSLRS